MPSVADEAATALERAYAQGLLSEGSADALLRVPQLGTAVGASLGEPAYASEHLLVTVLVDDSGSIGTRALEVRSGHDLLLDALASEPSTTHVSVLTRLLNRGLLSPYRPLRDAARLVGSNYQLRGDTPLYRESVLTLGTVIAQTASVEARGESVRTFTLIITDGGDNASGSIGASATQFLVADMLQFATNHVVAGMGIGDEPRFRRVFSGMGIPNDWILTPSSSAEDIRATFQTVAASLRLAVASRAAFLQLASGLERAES